MAASISIFSNLAGLELGKLVADEVLARFAQKTDTQPPTVVAADTPAVSKTNITLTGQVVDNLSGVAGATVSLDGGTATALALDATGHFSITTPYRLEGNDDGAAHDLDRRHRSRRQCGNGVHSRASRWIRACRSSP